MQCFTAKDISNSLLSLSLSLSLALESGGDAVYDATHASEHIDSVTIASARTIIPLRTRPRPYVANSARRRPATVYVLGAPICA